MLRLSSRRITLLLAILLLAVPLAPALAPPDLANVARSAPSAPPDLSPERHSPLREMALAYAGSFPAQPLPEGLDAQGRADYILNELPTLGRTPAEWLDWAAASFTLDPPAGGPAAADLGDATAALYAAVGASPSGPDLEAARDASAGVPADVRAPLANLVAAVADAYAAQAPLAREAAARLPAFTPDQPILALEERDAMARRAVSIVDAIRQVSVAVGPTPDQAVPVPAPICLAPVAPDCLAWLGGCGNDVYAPTPGMFPDPVLTVEPCGDDLYTNSAGGANPSGLLAPGNNLVVSVVADLGGQDDYLYAGEMSVVQGSGSVGGIGLLVDSAGDDVYDAAFERDLFGPYPLLGYMDGGAQGTGWAGFGLLLDAWGDDVYDLDVSSTSGRCIWGFAQGFGAAGGIGISSDLWGNDAWLSDGVGITSPSGLDDCWGQGTGDDAFQGLYPQGSAIYAGVGIMTDHGFGDDVYLNYNNARTVDYYAQGFGAFGGLGILFEDGGDDEYVAYEKATASWINPTLNCAYGTGSLAGVGIMLELGGNDTYLVETISNVGAESMFQGDGEPIPAYGLFVDADGADRHEGKASSTGGGTASIYGHGAFEPNHDLVGTFLDLGGDLDQYIPVIGVSPFGPTTNNNVWLFGADL
ncbi:MAG TPA: hypothetical protein VM327_01490 [Candidatus Thermoplasmatota archaeon]|nr:hypothetical protein [Candidatus Thermoplasmatota archaeon]